MQLKQAAHYTNIQPLLKSDNRIKGANYHEHDSVVQNEKLYEYEYFKHYLHDELYIILCFFSIY